MIDKNTILEIILLFNNNNLSNSFNAIGKVGLVGILYLSINVVSIKQCIDSELMKVQKDRF